MQNEKIKILTVIRNPVGGIRTYIKYTYGSLPTNKYHFTILTAKEDEADSDYIRQDLESYGLQINLIEVKGNWLNLRLLLSTFITLAKYRYDLIHSQGYTAGILTVIANFLIRKKHIITSHDVFRADQFPGFFGSIKKNVLEIILSMATRIQSVGNDAQKNLLQYLPKLQKNPDRQVVIQNGIKVENFYREKYKNENELRIKLQQAEDVFLFGFLGRFMPQKGFVYLIDAVEEIIKKGNDFNKIKIIAVNDGDYIKRYKRIIQEKGLSNYFVFHGFVPDVSAVIKDLTAVLMPSLWEAYSLLPIEAFVMGCPVIATNAIGLREVVNDTPALVAQKGDAHSFSQQIIRFMKDPQLYRKKTIDFIPTAQKRYTIEITAKKLDDLFEQLHTTR